MFNVETREYRTDRLTLQTQASTTVTLTTSLLGEAIEVGDFFEMAVICNVTANTSGAHGLYMQVSPDGGTTWGNSITLDADITTTANSTYTSVTNFGDTIRVGLFPSTTTSVVAYTVKAVLKR
jgi:hypothetical protein